MKVSQIYEIVNDALHETLGETAIIQEDLGNVVTVGKEVFDADKAHIYSKNLVNRIGKCQFVEYVYKGTAPDVYMDGWEYGSIRQKITFELRESSENEAWELQDKTSYDPNIFTEPKVDVRYFNGITTFEVPVSITETMIKQSFTSANELNSLISGIFLYIQNSLTLDADNLIMRTINNMIGLTIHDNNANRCRHLLTEYKKTHSDYSLAFPACLEDPDFIRFVCREFRRVPKFMKKFSTLYNIEGKTRFTSDDRLHVVMLEDLKAYADIYLQSTTFNDEYTKLINAETVPYWQGPGKTADVGNCATIDVVTSSGDAVKNSAVLCVMFDRMALGVCCQNDRTTSNYNGKAEFTNYWFRKDAQYFNDTSENFVVFLAD